MMGMVFTYYTCGHGTRALVPESENMARYVPGPCRECAITAREPLECRTCAEAGEEASDGEGD